MSRVAFLTSADSFWGAEEAGMTTRIVDDPSALHDEVRRLVSRGFSLIVVADDLVKDRQAEIEDAIERSEEEVSLVIVPGSSRSDMGFLKDLRRRFSMALGIDIWKMSGDKAGADF